MTQYNGNIAGMDLDRCAFATGGFILQATGENG
jgi:hypothetical protein